MPPARQATVAAAAQLRAQDLFSDGHHSAQTLCQAGEELDYVCHISHDASGSEVARQLCRAASWRTWAIQEFPNDTHMAQDSVREVHFWLEPDLPSRRGPRPPLGGIWVGAKPGTGAEGASSLTRAVRPNMHATRAIGGSAINCTARSWLVGRRTVSLSC